MKRFFSWVVVVVLSAFFALASSWVLSLAYKLLLWLRRYNETLYWVFVVLEGLAVLGFLIFAVFASAAGVVSASDSVCKSEKGTRYIVIGILLLLLVLAMLALVVLGDYLGTIQGNLLPMYFVYGTWFLYCIALMVTGKGNAKKA